MTMISRRVVRTSYPDNVVAPVRPTMSLLQGAFSPKVSNSGKPLMTPFGMSWYMGYAQEATAPIKPLPPIGTGDFTIFAVLYLPTWSSNEQTQYFCGCEPNGVGLIARLGAISYNCGAFVPGGNVSAGFTTASAYSATGLNVFIASRVSGRVYFRFNDTTSNVANSTDITAGVSTMTMNTYGQAGDGRPLQYFIFGGIENRGWSALEMLSVRQNPWQLFAPKESKIWIPGAVAGGLPILSFSTYKPGTLTVDGWQPRVTAS